MIYSANCKINIGLDILCRRDDGYHDLSTIIYPAHGLSDVVEVVHSDKFQFTSSGIEVDCAIDKNLCVKAYKLLESELGDLSPVHIHLHKIVPFGAGLGGGSSDATFTLIAINDLLDLRLSEQKLIDLAAQLGSDTPFFVKNKAQLCSSRGEVMQGIDLKLSGLYLTIVKPDVSISTREAFAGITPSNSVFDLSKLPQTDIKEWKNLIKNDFEATIFKSRPLLSQIKDNLYRSGAIYSSMSGSGSALYALSEKPLNLSLFKDYFTCCFMVE